MCSMQLSRVDGQTAALRRGGPDNCVVRRRQALLRLLRSTDKQVVRATQRMRCAVRPRIRFSGPMRTALARWLRVDWSAEVDPTSYFFTSLPPWIALLAAFVRRGRPRRRSRSAASPVRRAG